MAKRLKRRFRYVVIHKSPEGGDIRHRSTTKKKAQEYADDIRRGALLFDTRVPRARIVSTRTGTRVPLEHSLAEIRQEFSQDKEAQQAATRVEEVLELIHARNQSLYKVEFKRHDGDYYIFKVSISTKKTRKSFSVRVK